MQKHWGKQIFTHGRFPEVGQKEKKERDRLNDGNNNGQLSIANATSGGCPPLSNEFQMFSHKLDWSDR